MPDGVLDDGITDPILWVRLLPDGEGENTADGKKSYRRRLLVRVRSASVTDVDVRDSSRIPKTGTPLCDWFIDTDTADPDLSYRFYTDPINTLLPLAVDDDVRLATRTVTRTRDATYFEVVLFYEGVGDPTLEPAEFATSDVEYQEYVAYDVNGKPVMNSAFDPIDGGMPTKGYYKQITLTRNLPFEAWNTTKADSLKLTKNAAPFVLCGQYADPEHPEAGELSYGRGEVLLKDTSEQRLVKAKGSTPATTLWYWRVTATLLADLKIVRLPSGERVKRLHRWVIPDAGFNEWRDGRSVPIAGKASLTASQPQLLDGKGRKLLVQDMDKSFFVPIQPFVVAPQVLGGATLGVDYYAVAGDDTTTVPADRGVSANDVSPSLTAFPDVQLVDPIPDGQGSVSLNPDGSFTYVNALDPPFYGWTSFTYALASDPTGPKQTCFLLVGAVPQLLFFDPHGTGDWSIIAALLEGW